MRYLLDTHVWLWMRLAPQRLSAGATDALETGDNELWLSSISVWEVLVLAERGRVELPPSPAEWIARELAQVPLRDAPVDRGVVMLSQDLPLPQADPADRFIAATAVRYDLVLVTADSQLLRARACRLLDARRRGRPRAA